MLAVCGEVIRAAIAETAEECAQICEAEAAKWDVPGDPDPMGRLCAAAIRQRYGKP
jgi:hypothetical protein